MSGAHATCRSNSDRCVAAPCAAPPASRAGRGRVSQSPPWRRHPRGGGLEHSRSGRALPATVQIPSRCVHRHARRQSMPEPTGSRNACWPDGSGGRGLGFGLCWIRRRRRIPLRFLLASRRPSPPTPASHAARRVAAPATRIPLQPSRTTPRRSPSADANPLRSCRDRSGGRAGRPSR